MILIIGGKSSGKTTYANSLGFSADEIVDNVETFLNDKTDLEELVNTLLTKSVVICSEMGCGIIPLKKEDRELREKNGTLCTMLSSKADKVIRMVCGIPVIVKD